MFDLLREAYLIPKKFHGKAGANPVLLTDVDGNLLQEKKVSAREYTKFKHTRYINVHRDQKYIWQMDMILYGLMKKEQKLLRKKKTKAEAY